MDTSTESARPPALLEELGKLLAAHRGVFRQERVFRRMEALVFGSLCAFARHTLTQLLLALGLTDADWTAWYRLFSRERFQEEALAHTLFGEAVKEAPGVDSPYVVAMDATQFPRTSQKMPGTGWLKAPCTPPFKPGIHRAQRFVIGWWLLPIVEGFCRALPLRTSPAFAAKAVPSATPPRTEWRAGLGFLAWVRGELARAGRQAQQVLGIGDGHYDVVNLWQALPERVWLVARCALNRRLRARPAPATGRGRPRKYGEPVKTPREWLKEPEGWQEAHIPVRGHDRRMRYRVEGPYLRERAPDTLLFLLVLKGRYWQEGTRQGKAWRHRDPVAYLVSAVRRDGTWVLPCPVETLLGWLWQRWEAEVGHRELKSGLGVGEMQCWTSRSAETSVQWGVWLYGVLVLAGYRAWGLLGGPSTPGRWWPGGRRWSLVTLWRAYRAALWGTGGFKALCDGDGAHWGPKEGQLAALWNAAGAATRI